MLTPPSKAKNVLFTTLAFLFVIPGCGNVEAKDSLKLSKSILPLDVVVDTKCQETGCNRIGVVLKNTFEKAICVKAPQFPFDETPNIDVVTVFDSEGEEVIFNGPAPVILRNFDQAVLNYVVAPGNELAVDIELNQSFDLLEGENYVVRIQAAAVFCDLYNSGNPDKVYELDSHVVSMSSLKLDSEDRNYKAN